MGPSVKRVCTICARGGSKGVPGKNLRPILGKSVVGHTVEQARATNLFSAIAVTSDSPAILDVARAHGADFAVTRPAEMATDQASKLPAIAHCVDIVEQTRKEMFDVIVDLDPTAILRSPADIQGAVALLETKGTINVITGCPARRNPYFNLVELGPDGFVKLAKPPPSFIQRRQDAPRCFDMNAAVYVWWRELFRTTPGIFYPETLIYEMPEERSHDIDTAIDFQFVEFLMSQRSKS